MLTLYCLHNNTLEDEEKGEADIMHSLPLVPTTHNSETVSRGRILCVHASHLYGPPAAYAIEPLYLSALQFSKRLFSPVFFSAPTAYISIIHCSRAASPPPSQLLILAAWTQGNEGVWA